jgi:hypothetical protein
VKVKEILTEGYLAYELPEQARNELARRFPPKYPEFIGHHITQQFGVPIGQLDDVLPRVRSTHIKVIGYAETDGLEALVVEVNGTKRREDGKVYHITWSLDRSKGKKPVMSNDMIAQQGWSPVEPYVFDAQLRYFQ